MSASKGDINENPQASDFDYERLPEDEQKALDSMENGQAIPLPSTCVNTVFTLLEILVPLFTISQIVLLKFRDIILPECPTNLLITVTPLLACQTLLSCLMILCATILALYQEHLCGERIDLPPNANLIPAFVFSLFGNIFMFSTGGIVFVVETLKPLLAGEEATGCYGNPLVTITLAVLILVEFLVGLTCLFILAMKLYQSRDVQTVPNGAKTLGVALMVFFVGFVINQTGAAAVLESQSQLGLYFLTPSIQVDFLCEQLAIYILLLSTQTSNVNLNNMCCAVVIETAIMKWVAFSMDEKVLSLYFASEKISLKAVYFGSLLKCIAFSVVCIREILKRL